MCTKIRFLISRLLETALWERAVSPVGVTYGGKGHGLVPGNPQLKSGLHNQRGMLTLSIS